MVPLDPRRLEDYYRAGAPVHLSLGRSDVASICLLPGDPARVQRIARHLDRPRLLLQNREYTVVTGSYRGVPVTASSTGIGSSSTEIAVLELASLGVRTFIRVGGTGAISADLPPGTLVLNTAMMRLDGATESYAPPGYPAVAHPEVLNSLRRAVAEASTPHALGIGATTSSYYHGQGRLLWNRPDALAPASGIALKELQTLGILNLDMETATLFILSSLMGLRAGSILGVHVNRITQQWDSEYEATQERAIRAALRAAELLHAMDASEPTGRPFRQAEVAVQPTAPANETHRHQQTGGQ